MDYIKEAEDILSILNRDYSIEDQISILAVRLKTVYLIGGTDQLNKDMEKINVPS